VAARAEVVVSGDGASALSRAGCHRRQGTAVLIPRRVGTAPSRTAPSRYRPSRTAPLDTGPL